MSEPIVITDAMRRAVLAEMCATQGHQLDMSTALGPGDGGRYEVRSNDPARLAHVHCARCGKSWIVVEDPGLDYDDAEMKLRDRLLRADPLNRRPARPRRSPSARKRKSPENAEDNE